MTVWLRFGTDFFHIPYSGSPRQKNDSHESRIRAHGVVMSAEGPITPEGSFPAADSPQRGHGNKWCCGEKRDMLRKPYFFCGALDSDGAGLNFRVHAAIFFTEN